jgi:serine/threonine-protein kinase
MPKAKEAAEKALALDDSSADAHTSLGLVKLDFDRDVVGAQREFLRAMQLNPSSGYIRHWYAHSLEAQNRLDAAMREMRAAQTLDPLLMVLAWDVANELLAAHRPDEALRHLTNVDELFPNLPLSSYFRVEAYHQKGELTSARGVLNGLSSTQPELTKEPMFVALFGVAAAREGRREDARHALETLEELRRTQYVDPVLVIELCSVLNDRAQLLLWLRRAHEERSTLFVYLPLRKELYAGDAEAEALVAQLN